MTAVIILIAKTSIVKTWWLKLALGWHFWKFDYAKWLKVSNLFCRFERRNSSVRMKYWRITHAMYWNLFHCTLCLRVYISIVMLPGLTEKKFQVTRHIVLILLCDMFFVDAAKRSICVILKPYLALHQRVQRSFGFFFCQNCQLAGVSLIYYWLHTFWNNIVLNQITALSGVWTKRVRGSGLGSFSKRHPIFQLQVLAFLGFCIFFVTNFTHLDFLVKTLTGTSFYTCFCAVDRTNCPEAEPKLLDAKCLSHMLTRAELRFKIGASTKLMVHLFVKIILI